MFHIYTVSRVLFLILCVELQCFLHFADRSSPLKFHCMLIIVLSIRVVNQHLHWVEIEKWLNKLNISLDYVENSEYRISAEGKKIDPLSFNLLSVLMQSFKSPGGICFVFWTEMEGHWSAHYDSQFSERTTSHLGSYYLHWAAWWGGN